VFFDYSRIRRVEDSFQKRSSRTSDGERESILCLLSFFLFRLRIVTLNKCAFIYQRAERKNYKLRYKLRNFEVYTRRGEEGGRVAQRP